MAGQATPDLGLPDSCLTKTVGAHVRVASKAGQIWGSIQTEAERQRQNPGRRRGAKAQSADQSKISLSDPKTPSTRFRLFNRRMSKAGEATEVAREKGRIDSVHEDLADAVKLRKTHPSMRPRYFIANHNCAKLFITEAKKLGFDRVEFEVEDHGLLAVPIRDRRFWFW
jgi:hypothetical protein